MPLPNKKRQQTESGSAPSVWLQQAAGLVCNIGELLLNPGPGGGPAQSEVCSVC